MQWDDYSVKICNVYYHFNIMTLVISFVFLSKTNVVRGFELILSVGLFSLMHKEEHIIHRSILN